MPVASPLRLDGIGVVPSRGMDCKFLPVQLFRQSAPDLYSDSPGRDGIPIPEVDAGLLRFNPVLRNQLVLPGLFSRHINIDIFAAQEQKKPRRQQPQGKERQ